MFIEIDNIILDIEALSSIAHECNPVACASRPNCCQIFEVCIGKRELNRMTDFIPLAAAFSKSLKKGKSYKNVFDEVDPGLYAIDKTSGNQCVFAYTGGVGEVLCSLHSAAVRAGKQPEAVKPKACTLWPLALTDSKPYYLSIDDNAFSFPCNLQRTDRTPLFHPGVVDIIRQVFGAGFLEKLNSRQPFF